MLSLLRRPDQEDLLRSDPEQLETAVEEFLRFESPVQMTSRIVLEDLELGGVALRAGQHVDVLLGAANRDPQAFAHPERLDVRRSPNPQLALGSGAHTCLGAGLARLEGQIALRLLLERYPRLRLAEPEARWRKNVAFRGLERLLVTAE
jgi:cytochrome P450